MTDDATPVPQPRPAEPLVQVAGLTVDFPVGQGFVRAVDGLDLTLEAGQALGIVGESGSGKSTVVLALLGMHNGTGARLAGTATVAGIDALTAEGDELRRLRGGSAAMVFQDPLSALDPYHAVGDQIAEVHRVHRRVSRRTARARAVEVLDRVGIPDAARRSRSRPHEFSGGMRQRVLIAMALACEPRLLVADEPTTALDVTVQAQILDLLHEVRAETGAGLLLVTHDLGVIAGSVDRVLVMKDGRALERGPVGEVLTAPRQAYSRALIAAVPRLDAAPADRPAFQPQPGENGEVLLEATDLRREFGRRGNAVHAVDGVSLTVRRGETLGIVGESGSGKTTLGRMLVRLLEPSAGRLLFDGHDLSRLREKELHPFRRDLQMVFQDPVSSLNPRRSIGESVADPLRTARRPLTDREIRDRVRSLLDRVGLDPDWYGRYPHQLSGGQRQRVGIARALAPEPRLVVCDEPVSALDVTTQSHVVALLGELQRDLLAAVPVLDPADAARRRAGRRSPAEALSPEPDRIGLER